MARLLITMAVAAACAAAQSRPAAPAPPDNGVVWITQKARAEGVGTQVLLGDIADVDALDAPVAARLKRLVIDELPPSRRTVLIARSTLALRLGDARVNSSIVQWKGSENTSVEVRSVRLPGNDVVDMGRRYAREKLGAAAATATFGETVPPDAFVTTAGRWSTRFVVRTAAPDDSFAGPVRLTIVALVDGLEREHMDFLVDIRRRGRVLVAAHDLNPGATMRADDTVVADRDLVGGTEWVLASADVAGLVLSRRVATGQTLTTRDFRARPVIERDDRITVRYRAGALTVTGQAKALGAGAPGEVIAVQIITSDPTATARMVQARVVDSRTVEAGPDGAGMGRN